MKKDERQQLHAQEYYIPLSSQGTQGHDVERPRLLIAEPTVPDQACGKAHRVGTVRVQGTLFALYRLHVAVQGPPESGDASSSVRVRRWMLCRSRHLGCDKDELSTFSEVVLSARRRGNGVIFHSLIRAFNERVLVNRSLSEKRHSVLALPLMVLSFLKKTYLLRFRLKMLPSERVLLLSQVSSLFFWVP